VGALPDDLLSTDWAALAHAYGSAENIPSLLRAAETDTRGGHVPGSPWFSLWSALCHQGDTYTASYAAVPHLIRLASLQAFRENYEPLYLAACIEVSRVEGRGPASGLLHSAASYREALNHGKELAQRALARPLGDDARSVYEGCLCAFAGDYHAAHAIWDKEDLSAV
jgi:hypothetical protein